ncbi:MAG: deoxyribose-phosphate aldolase [Gelidibacter sp.]|nr:deoxyribose-phosphate aldolase [Gelidibacter sp.]
MRYLLALLLSFALFGCNNKQNKKVDAHEIIKKSIEVSGGKRIGASIIEFNFRDIHYKAVRNKGIFLLSRVIPKDGDSIIDVLGNDGFKRFINDSLVSIPDSMAVNYTASVNSVHYFAVLPYGLDGKAVNKTYMDKVDLKGDSYHKIKITFNEEGGGEDFEDVFIYWVNTKSNKVDYLAYSYNEDDGKGLRFREAYNERYIEGIRFVDYNNYKPIDVKAKPEDLDKLYIDNKLELVSKIELKNVTVN